MRRVAGSLAFAVVLLTVSTASPQEPARPNQTHSADRPWYERIEFMGDVRLRYEGFVFHDTPERNWRHRFRTRIRAGITTQVTSWMNVGLELRSGDPLDPVSDNQSYEGGFSLKDISIAEGYAAFDATRWLDIWAGKFDPKRLWTVSDLQWDDDVTVEGILERLRLGPFEASLYQYILEERSDAADASLYGGQLRAGASPTSNHDVSVGAGFDGWLRPQLVVDLTLGGDLRGNEVTNLLDDDGLLISDFDIANVFATWRYTGHETWPVRTTLYGYKNTGAKGKGTNHDLGAFARLQVGDYKRRGQLMVRYSFYYSEPDAMFYVFTQSDTNRGSDVRGHRVDLRVGLVANSYTNITWYHTDAVLADVSTMDRWQLDYIITF